MRISGGNGPDAEVPGGSGCAGTETAGRLRRILEDRREEFLAPLLDLVARDTRVLGHGIEGGRERNGQEYLEGLLRSLGAETAREPLTEELIREGIDRFGEGNPGHDYRDRWNLVARFPGGGGPSILFDGHVDTMPPGDLARWSFDPLRPEIVEGRLRGLGACDMKGGLMASVQAVRLLREAGLDRPGDVTILSVVDEEGGGNGTLAALLRGHRADAAVVCEPNSCALTRAHMGFLFFRVEVSGVALHSGTKWRGVNAIEKAVLLMEALNDLERRWLMERRHPLLPPPTLNVGVIEGGTAGSTVPDRCVFQLCLHYLPGMDRDEVVRQVEEALALRSAGDSWLRDHPPRVSIYQEGRPFEQEEDHPFVEAAKEACRAAFGRDPTVDGSAAGNDARLLRNIGGMPTIILGPGPLENCHRPDEWLPVEEYLRCVLAYALLILNWGGREG
jgi:acetylornithine deacetylase